MNDTCKLSPNFWNMTFTAQQVGYMIIPPINVVIGLLGVAVSLVTFIKQWSTRWRLDIKYTVLR